MRIVSGNVVCRMFQASDLINIHGGITDEENEVILSLANEMESWTFNNKEQREAAESIAMYVKEQKPAPVEALQKKPSILEEANGLIYGDRAASYGPAKEQFEKIGRVTASILTETELYSLACQDITSQVIAKVMIATKLVRDSYNPKKDNRRDAAGYLGLLDDILEE